MLKEAAPSHLGSPVTCHSTNPPAAITSPASAAMSSRITAFSAVSDVARRYLRSGTPTRRAPPSPASCCAGATRSP